MLEFLKGSFLVHYTFLLYINDIPCEVISVILVIYADDTTLYSKSDQTSDL